MAACHLAWLSRALGGAIPQRPSSNFDLVIVLSLLMEKEGRTENLSLTVTRSRCPLTPSVFRQEQAALPASSKLYTSDLSVSYRPS